MLVQEGCGNVSGMDFCSVRVSDSLCPSVMLEEAIFLVFFDFHFPLKILIFLSYRVGDVGERWADFALGVGGS